MNESKVTKIKGEISFIGDIENVSYDHNEPVIIISVTKEEIENLTINPIYKQCEIEVNP